MQYSPPGRFFDRITHMTKEQLKRHKIAAKKIETIKNKAFKLIKRNLGRISEYDVQEFILSEYKKEGMITLRSDAKYVIERHPPQIIAVNENAANPHYFPLKRKSKIIKKNNLILVDIWARLEGENSPFADITWMAYSGKNLPQEIKKIFSQVIKAKSVALSFIRNNLQHRQFPKTSGIDKVTRDYFKKLGLDKYFIHRTGHSLGLHICHGKYFRLGKQSNTRLKPDIPFTIEPGLYFKNKFGVRSEINCYVTEDYKLRITTKVQQKIIKI